MVEHIKETPSIKISNPSVKEVEYIPFQQSANVLFNFMRKLDYLKLIISNKSIIPRYNEESIEYLRIENLNKITFPMTCFCDINLQKLIPHVEFYGYYGIGLDKKWGLNIGIQPIKYVNPNSHIVSDYAYIFSKSLKTISQYEDIVDEYNNYLLLDLLFMKPISGMMYRDNKYVNRNFHDEREWRYIPNMRSQYELPLLIPQNRLNPKAYSLYSKGIAKIEELWLKFEYENIKYLIVKDDSDQKELIRFILKGIPEINSDDKALLISKIIVFEDIKEDW